MRFVLSRDGPLRRPTEFIFTGGSSMFYERWTMKALLLLGCIVFVFGGSTAYGSQLGNIAVGATLPGFSLEAPASAKDKAYLGLEETSSFYLSQIHGKIILMELMGVF
jgi:hypothetical protein